MYTIPLDTDGEFIPCFPSFTFSHTLPGQLKKTLWVTTDKVKEELENRGLRISKQTLFNLESKSVLSTLRPSPRKVYFNILEVLEHFSLI